MHGVNAIFYVIVLIMSVVVHEVAHGLAADSQGDPTARYAGRLTFNPLKHIDLVGSILLPTFLILMKTGFVIGWAKPVPYNEGNLRNKKWGTILVASAGILANIGLALIFGTLFRFGVQLGFPAYDALAPHPLYVITGAIALVNLILAFFNLIPVPPLDGSKILFALLPRRFARMRTYIESFSLVLLLLFIFFFWPKLVPFVGNLFGFITGV